jgi:hypothetical protein
MKAPVATSAPRQVGCAVKRIGAYVPDPDSALYAFLLHDPLRKATERAGAILAPKPKATAKVTKFPARAEK